MTQPVTVFEAVGGKPFFVDLIDRFYDAVETDPVLRPLYPDDLTESRRHMVGFLSQYWGGPADYSAERGHPRLRMRHAPFVIGVAERDAWLKHMVDSIAAAEPSMPDGIADSMRGYFANAADHMINSTG